MKEYTADPNLMPEGSIAKLFIQLEPVIIGDENREAMQKILGSYKALQHHYDTTMGMWCTDVPERVYDPTNVMFRLWDDKETKPAFTGRLPRPKQRPVHFRVYIEPKEGTAGFWFSTPGVFIRWADSFERFHVGPGNMTVAIVEAEDGQVFKVDPANMQFTDVPGITKMNNDLRNHERSVVGYEVKELNRAEVKQLFKRTDHVLEHVWKSGTDLPATEEIVEARWAQVANIEGKIGYNEIWPVYYRSGDSQYRHANSLDKTYEPIDIEWREAPQFSQ